jgi:hypothetical protein
MGETRLGAAVSATQQTHLVHKTKKKGKKRKRRGIYREEYRRRRKEDCRVVKGDNNTLVVNQPTLRAPHLHYYYTSTKSTGVQSRNFL